MHPSAPDMSPIEATETLADRVHARIKQALLTGGFVPGQQLKLRNVAQTLGVSLTPAREAIMRLVAEGALEASPNRSVTVPRLDQGKLHEVYRIRRLLEGTAAEEAMNSFDDSSLARLEEIQIGLEAAMDRQDFRSVLLANYAFHFTIYNAAGMPLLTRLIESIWVQIGSHLNLLYPNYARQRSGVQHHQEALEAIRRHDAKALRRAIEDDLTDGEELLLRRLDDDLAEIAPSTALREPARS